MKKIIFIAIAIIAAFGISIPTSAACRDDFRNNFENCLVCKNNKKTYQKQTHPAQGFEIYQNDSQMARRENIKGVFITVEVNSTGSQLYFSDAYGDRLRDLNWFWVNTARVSKYRFVQIVSDEKIHTNFIENNNNPIFPDSSYYVWSELELTSGDLIIRPVPVSEEDFKKLKNSKVGTEFVPLFEKQ